MQLFETVPHDQLYRRYWYRSGVNEAMREELRSIVRSAAAYVNLVPGDVVLDIGSNDGTLLACYPEELLRVGVDPSDVARQAPFYKGPNAVLVNDFYSAPAVAAAVPGRARVVTIVATFYDVEHPKEFLDDVRKIIHDDGLLVIQLSYTPLMLQANEFGAICHEHLCYYTFATLQSLLCRSGFAVIDAQLNGTNGGSLRVYATIAGRERSLRCPAHWLYVGACRSAALLQFERQRHFDRPEPYRRFMRRVQRLKTETVRWLERARDGGATVVGYGASTKGNVMLQYYGVTRDLLPCIADRSPAKWGLYTAGTGIPVIPEAEMRAMRPDFLFVLPWFFASTFVDRERDLITAGTRIVLPLPELTVLDIGGLGSAVCASTREAPRATGSS
ncbi:MAG: class I SAM-dependent methyltransferase [Gemmatimonadales bacterium]